MPNRACLEIINLNGEVAFHTLDPGRGITTIGRHAENQVVINHPDVAPFHAVLDHRHKPYRIIVLDDEGETKLGGHLLSPDTPMALHNLDTLEIAGHTIILFADEDVAAKASPVSAATPPPLPLTTATASSSPGMAVRPPGQHDDCTLTASCAREGAVDVEQESYYEFRVGELIPKRQTLSWFTQSGQVSIPITNNSNCEALFHLKGEDEAGGCSFEFQVPGETVSLAKQVELRVKPGETVLVPVRITPLSRRLISLGKQAHFCTITTTLLGEQPTRRTVLAQLQSAPLIGPGLTALITICLVVLMGLLLQRVVSYATTDVKVARGNGTEKTSSVHSVFAENTASEANAGEMTYEEMFREIAQEYDLDWRLLAEQAYQESRLDPLAIGDDNEVGLMQMLPSTWDEWAPKVGASDPWDPYNSVLVAAAYLAFLKEHCSDMGYPGDDWMLAAYNWGPHNLSQLLEGGGSWAQLPAETRQYVLDILQATEADTVDRLAGLKTRRLSANSR